MTRRILSVILALLMAASLFGAVATSVSAANVTTGFIPATPGSYEKVGDVSALAAGDEILIVDEAAAMTLSTTQNGNNRAAAAVTVSAGQITVPEGNETIQSFVLAEADEGFYLLAGEGLYLYAPNAYNGSSSGNYLRTTDTESAAHAWTLTENAVSAVNYSARGILHYNANNGNPIFSCYSSAGAVAIYKRGAEGCAHPNAVYTVTEEPGCTSAGARSWSCPDCGQTGAETIPALGHAWDEGTVITPAACETPGQIQYLCTRDQNHSRTEALPALGHLDADGDQVCDRCGQTLSTADTYVLANSIREGDRIMFVYSDDSVTKAAGPIAGSGVNTYLTAVNAEILDDAVVCADALVFDVEAGTAAGSFAFRSGGKYLDPSTAASGTNYIHLSATAKSELTDWTVSFSEGVATVSHAISSSAVRSIKYNLSSPRFSAYLSGQQDIAIYKLATEQDLVDVYVVDQTNSESFNAYVFNRAADANDGTAWPGHALECLGKDFENNNYYHLTLDRAAYDAVIFNNGSSQNDDAHMLVLDADMAGAIAVYNNSAWEASYLASNDVYPAANAVVTAPGCTEGGFTVYNGLLGSVSEPRDLTDALGHAWGAWAADGSNSHSRVCAHDASHVETELCTDADNDGLCEVCGGAIVPVTGYVESGRYVIAGLVNGGYYALPCSIQSQNPAGTLVSAVDYAVAESEARGYIYSVQLLPNGYYTISSGEAFLGSSGSDSGIRTLAPGEALNDSFYWNISAGEHGSFRVANVGASSRALAYRKDASFDRFGAYAAANIDGLTYYDLELLPVLSEQDPDSSEDIDVYFVDETDTDSPYAYYYNENNPPDPEDTGEDLAGYPGTSLSSVGLEKGGHRYYKLTLNATLFTHILFNNGLTGGVEAGNQTVDLDFRADAVADPLEEDGNRFVVYYVYRDGLQMAASPGSDLWPAPPTVIREAGCTESGLAQYVGLRTGVIDGQVELPALGHDWDEWSETAPPSCTEAGAERRICARCDAAETRTLEPLGHTRGEAVQENVVPATCSAEGSYDEVVYCTVCNEELSREPKTIEKLAHTPAEPVIENEVPATCTEAGSYESVVYCSECGEEISRETVAVAALGHNPGEAVRENYVEPTATTDGGYDTVVHCTRCNAELSREHTVLPATGPAEPVLDESIVLYNSIGIGIEIQTTFGVRKSVTDRFESWYIEVSKLDASGNVTETRRFGAGQEGAVSEGYIREAVYTDITAKEMGVRYAASFHGFAADGSETYSNTVTNTVRDYVIEELLKTDNDDATRRLAADLLNYGAAAQVYFNFDTENLVNANLSAEAQAAMTQFADVGEAPATLENGSNGPNVYGSVSVMNRVVLSLTVRGVGSPSEVKVLVKNHETGEVKATIDAVQRGTVWMADYAGFEAEDMRTAFDFVPVADGTETGTPLTWSVEGYAKQARQNEDASEAELALFNALLHYVDAAKAAYGN